MYKRIKGREQYYINFDNLTELLKQCDKLTSKKIAKIFNEYSLDASDEQIKVIKETLLFAKDMMFFFDLRVLTLKDMQRFAGSKDYIYKVFFKAEYEPIVEKIK